jgi:hypothetical protein
MLYEFIMLDTIWFWGALAIPTILLLLFAFNEKGTPSTIIVVLTIAAIVSCSDFPTREFIHALTVGHIIKYAGGYVLLGLIYMSLKWIYTAYELKVKYVDYKEAWLERIGLKSLPETHTDEFANFKRALLGATGINIADLPPKIRRHKARLVFWACYWPFSFVSTMLGNPLKHLVNFILSLLSKPLNYVSSSLFSEFKELNK